MRAYTAAEKARMTFFIEDFLAATNFGTVRELSFQLKQLERNQIPLRELTDIMDAITSGRAYEFQNSLPPEESE